VSFGLRALSKSPQGLKPLFWDGGSTAKAVLLHIRILGRRGTARSSFLLSRSEDTSAWLQAKGNYGAEWVRWMWWGSQA